MDTRLDDRSTLGTQLSLNRVQDTYEAENEQPTPYANLTNLQSWGMARMFEYVTFVSKGASLSR
jgi:hypothetical protein